MRVQDCNWMQLEEYLRGDDRIVLPLGSIEQHAYLSLAVDVILSERVSVEAAEPLGVPVMPSLPYGITPYFAAYPGSPTLSVETYGQSFASCSTRYGQGFRRFLGQRPRRQRPGRHCRSERRASRRPGRLAQLVERPAHLGGRPVDRQRREPCFLAREFPLDAPRGRHAAVRAQADGRHLDDACDGSGRRARAAGRRLARRPLRTSRRRRAAGVASRRRGSARPDREQLVACLSSPVGRRSSRERRTESVRRLPRRSGSTARRARRRHIGRRPTATVAALCLNCPGRHPGQRRRRVGRVGRPLEEVSDDDWQAVVDANPTSTFVCTRVVLE